MPDITSVTQNIQKMIMVTIDLVEELCNKYNIDLSEVNEDEVGTFVLPELQEKKHKVRSLKLEWKINYFTWGKVN